jgi:hypothetical protein
MKTLAIFSVIVLALSMFVASGALAECPEGKAEVTIVKGKSGKVMTMCVGEAAIPHIGGPGDVVIPATCPCFTLEEVDTAIANDPDSCVYIYSATDINGVVYEQAFFGGDENWWRVQLEDTPVGGEWKVYGSESCLSQLPLLSKFCEAKDNNCCDDEEAEFPTGGSHDEMRSCVEILRNALSEVVR